MKVQKVKSRGILFTAPTTEGWDLNTYLILGKKYDFMIDTGLGPLSVAPMMEYLKPGKPVVIINTHYDWDHVWGNGAVPGAMIVSHSLCRKMIESKWDEMMQENGRLCMGKVDMVLPNLVFEKELYFPEDRVRLIYTPGHTIDSISVLDETDRVLHAGDNVGDTPQDLVPGLACEKKIYMETLNVYRDLDFDTCVSGHNVILGKEIFESIRISLTENE